MTCVEDTIPFLYATVYKTEGDEAVVCDSALLIPMFKTLLLHIPSAYVRLCPP